MEMNEDDNNFSIAEDACLRLSTTDNDVDYVSDESDDHDEETDSEKEEEEIIKEKDRLKKKRLLEHLQKFEYELFNIDCECPENENSRKELAEIAKVDGNIFFKQGNYVAAIQMYSKAIKLWKNEPSYYSNRCAALLKLHCWKQADNDASFLLDNFPEWIKSYYRKASCLFHLFKFKEAAQVASQGRAIEPRDPVLTKLQRLCKARSKEPELWGFGDNSGGQIGLRKKGGVVWQPNRISIPHRIKGKITKVVCGLGHTIMLTELGEVLSWGEGAYGQLGHKEQKDYAFPKVVTFLKRTGCRFVDAACGFFFSLVLSDDGRLYAFGGNEDGQLGLGFSARIRIPAEIPEHKFLKISAGGNSSLALDYYGKMYTWGSNLWGQLGIGENGGSDSPVIVRGVDGLYFDSISCGETHCLALTGAGKLYAWGSNKRGQLGITDKEVQKLLAPKEIHLSFGDAIFQICAGSEFSAILTDSGELYTWGQGENGRLGHGSSTSSPHKIETKTTFIACTLGGSFAAAISDNLGCYTWGNGTKGQVGHKDHSKYFAPHMLEISNTHEIVDISCGGGDHTMVIATPRDRNEEIYF